MIKIFLKYFLLILLIILIISGCEQKIIPPKDEGLATTQGDTSYIEIFPPWGLPGKPRAILIGNDQLIYVADYENSKIYMMDASGAILKSRDILHPVSIAQNSKLDLYVGAETIAPNGIDTIGAIYRLSLVRWDTTYIAGVRIDTLLGDTTYILRDTSYFYYHDLENAHMRIIYKEPARPQRRFPGIGILPGNDYLVARTGNDNSSFVDPDARVLKFNNKDILETPLGDLVTRSTGGTAITDIRDPTGIMIFPSSNDFILTQNSSQDAYGAVWMVFYETADFKGWLPKFDPSRSDQRGIDFIKTNRFINATAAAYDKRRREIFIIDSELDSVVKFNRNGQFRSESFGKYKTSSDRFPGLNHPHGIAYSNDCTLYIADTGNKVIRRFRLSTQTQCN